MSPTDEGFSSDFEVTIAAVLGGVGLDEKSRLSVGRTFFEGEGLIAIDSDKLLHYLWRNSTLKLEVTYSSSSFSQIIRGTSQFTPTSTSSWEDENDGEEEDDEEDDENEVVRSRILAFRTGHTSTPNKQKE